MHIRIQDDQLLAHHTTGLARLASCKTKGTPVSFMVFLRSVATLLMLSLSFHGSSANCNVINTQLTIYR